YEKFVLGWIPQQPRITRAGRYVLSPPTTGAPLTRALVVDAEEGTWWIEYRVRPFRGLLLRFVDNSQHPLPFSPSAVLIEDPARHHRPWLRQGEAYRLPLSYRVTLVRAASNPATVPFRFPSP